MKKTKPNPKLYKITQTGTPSNCSISENQGIILQGKYVPTIAWDILIPKLHLLFLWISNLVGCRVLTLAILHLRPLPAPE